MSAVNIFSLATKIMDYYAEKSKKQIAYTKGYNDGSNDGLWAGLILGMFVSACCMLLLWVLK